MQGKVLGYDSTEQSGNIAGYDGNRYQFFQNQYKSGTLPVAGDVVDFVINGERADEVFIVQNAPISTQTSAMAITSLIFGILGLMSSWFMFGIPSFLAIIFGHIARGQIKKSKGRLSGSEIAVIGLVMGYIVFVLTLLTVLGFLGFVAAMNEAANY